MTLGRYCSHHRLCFSLCVLWLCSWTPIVLAQKVNYVAFFIDGDRVDNGEGSHAEVTRCQGEELVIGCGYRETPLTSSDISLSDTTSQPPVKLSLREDPDTISPIFDVLIHTLGASDATGRRTFVCVANGKGISARVTVTIDFVQPSGTNPSCTATSTTQTPTPTDTPSTHSPSTDPSSSTDTPSSDTPSTDTPSTDTPSTDTLPTGPGSTDPTTSGTSNSGRDSTSSGMSFKGLKPLIYTVASVILLGTLAIIAIVTCWIRARRSFHNRVIRPNNTPQDYLDYISDNEFTPLTTSEFMASLQERPPTYNQSEEMIQADTADSSRGEETAQTAAGDSSGQSANQSVSGTQSAPLNTTGGEGTPVERRRQRGGSAGRRRRRHVVIVENGDSQSDGNLVTSVRSGTTPDELGERGSHRQTQSQSVRSSVGDGTSRGSNVTVLVNVQLPPLELSAGHSQRGSFTPTQQEIDTIEARVNMVENLSPPPPSSDCHSTPTSDEAGKNTSDNLIDFSTLPP